MKVDVSKENKVRKVKEGRSQDVQNVEGLHHCGFHNKQVMSLHLFLTRARYFSRESEATVQNLTAVSTGIQIGYGEHGL